MVYYFYPFNQSAGIYRSHIKTLHLEGTGQLLLDTYDFCILCSPQEYNAMLLSQKVRFRRHVYESWWRY